MGKQAVVYTYNGTLLGHKKNEFKSVPMRWMDPELAIK